MFFDCRNDGLTIVEETGRRREDLTVSTVRLVLTVRFPGAAHDRNGDSSCPFDRPAVRMLDTSFDRFP